MLEDPEIKIFNPFNSKSKILNKLDGIIIDEVSMVGPDIIDAIDCCLRRNVNKDLPFGGKQIIMLGDLLQLEVIGGDLNSYNNPYSGKLFTKAMALKKQPFKTIQFKKIYRQENIKFKETLSRIRTNNYTDYDIRSINSRLIKDSENLEEGVITLCTTNHIAKDLNYKKLNSIPGKPINYIGRIMGNFPKLPTEKIIYIKKESQIMFIKNDPKGRWFNGSIGKVIDMGEEQLEIK